MMTRERAVCLVLLAMISPTMGCRARPASQGDTIAGRQVIRHDGRDRTYVVRVPVDVGRSRDGVPLVLVLHGGGGNASRAETITGFTDKAEAEGFIVAYPEGTSRRRPLLTWNAGHCCGYVMEQGVNDAGCISALIDELASRYPVDLDRVFVTGMSNGAPRT